MAIAPRSVPEKSFSEPISLPIGVRAPATITDVVICYLQKRFERLRCGYPRVTAVSVRVVQVTFAL